MPRVDVHSHCSTVEQIDALMRMAALLQDRHQVHLAVFFNLQEFQPVGNPPPLTKEFFDAVENR